MKNKGDWLFFVNKFEKEVTLVYQGLDTNKRKKFEEYTELCSGFSTKFFKLGQCRIQFVGDLLLCFLKLILTYMQTKLTIYCCKWLVIILLVGTDNQVYHYDRIEFQINKLVNYWLIIG